MWPRDRERGSPAGRRPRVGRARPHGWGASPRPDPRGRPRPRPPLPRRSERGGRVPRTQGEVGEDWGSGHPGGVRGGDWGGDHTGEGGGSSGGRGSSGGGRGDGGGDGHPSVGCWVGQSGEGSRGAVRPPPRPLPLPRPLGLPRPLALRHMSSLEKQLHCSEPIAGRYL